jgi:hypothetical protein
MSRTPAPSRSQAPVPLAPKLPFPSLPSSSLGAHPPKLQLGCYPAVREVCVDVDAPGTII